jgi:hypothetical protein
MFAKQFLRCLVEEEEEGEFGNWGKKEEGWMG